MKYFLLVGMSCASLAFSQTKGSVSINTNTPKSTLDVNAKDKNSATEIVGLQISLELQGLKSQLKIPYMEITRLGR